MINTLYHILANLLFAIAVFYYAAAFIYIIKKYPKY